METHTGGVQKRFPATSENHLRYLLYLPPSFDDLPDRQWPVLCFLHGFGEAAKGKTGEDKPIETLLNHGSPAWHCELNSPLIRDFIVISPQRPLAGQWTTADFDKVEQLVQAIHSKLRGDPSRTFLTGFSYGGQAVFDLVNWADANNQGGASHRVQWNALWAVDDANPQPRVSCSAQRIWLHFGLWKPDPQSSTVKNLKLIEAKAFRATGTTEDRVFTDYGTFGYEHAATCAASYADWRVYRWLLR